MKSKQRLSELKKGVGVSALKDNKDLKRLDTKVSDFLNLIIEDADEHNTAEVKKHAKSFENFIHKEIDLLIKDTKEDLKLYNNILISLKKFKEKMHEISNTNSKAEILANYELRYAKTLLEQADDKLTELNKVFRNLKKA